MKRDDSIQLARRGAFSLIEMMIAIVILGLGLTMVATMFPVAWDRARQLSEFTTEQTVTEGVAVTVESMLRPGGMRDAPSADSNCTDQSKLRLGTAGLAGDLIFDPNIYYTPGLLPAELPLAILNDWQNNRYASDTRVHALNLENLLADAASPPEPVGEEPWKLEQIETLWLASNYPDEEFPRQLACGFEESSFLTPRFPVNMRIYPPLDALPELAQTMGPERRKRWLDRAERRRFAWAVLHRLRNYVGPTPDDFLNLSPEQLATKAAEGWGSPRVFDMYYVTLRRPNATNRYAMQDPDHVPDPHTLQTTPETIQALPLNKDVLFPVAWRVQIDLRDSGTLNTLADRSRLPTGIPTSVRVPPKGTPEAMIDMMISMFPKATRFVDEITGRVYRVVTAELNSDGTQAILTLDQEITLEDIDLLGVRDEGVPVGPPECRKCKAVTSANPNADPEELIRTVWVYPPAVDRSQGTSQTDVVFTGRTPVSTIEVRSVTLTPP